jgi:hypothetical protein
MSPETVTELLVLLRRKSNLHELSLHKIKINEEDVVELINIIKQVKTLKKIDLQWLELSSNKFMDILECLA